MLVEPYDNERDLAAVTRIWEECRWIDDDEDDRAALAAFAASSPGHVARLDGEAECLVTATHGQIRYQNTDLPLAAISSVTTSLVGRKQGLARAVAAESLRQATRDGAAVSVLGMFEQGFYDLLGFGSGSYEQQITVDPATITVDLPYRRPVRLTINDWQDVHACMINRGRTHGGVALTPPERLQAEMAWTEVPFGLGFRDDNGILTHCLWGEGKGEHGPFKVSILAAPDQRGVLELLRLLRSLDDQVRSVRLMEPPGIQLQDLITHVGRQENVAAGTHGFAHTSGTWWQVRILDLSPCIAARQWDGGQLRFNLDLSDPLTTNDWQGTAGQHVVTISDESGAEPGHDDALPSLTATVNAFSRLWLGVRPATSLALTDQLDGPRDLLRDLDRAFADLPPPHPGMDF